VYSMIDAAIWRMITGNKWVRGQSVNGKLAQMRLFNGIKGW